MFRFNSKIIVKNLKSIKYVQSKYPLANISRNFSSKNKNISYDFKTIVEMQSNACDVYADRRAFGSRKGVGADSTYEWISYKEFGVLVNQCKNILNHHHIAKGDKVAIISNNRLEWAALNYATNSLGAQFVPMYEAQTEKDWKYIINDSDSKLIIAATESIYNRTKDFVGSIGKVEAVLCLDSSPDYLFSFKRWLNIVKKEPIIPNANILEDDIAVIIYTSGTTGNPKGVELSHKNIVSNLHGLKNLWIDTLDEQTSLAFLPWAHVYGQTSELHSLFAAGSSLGIVSSRELILDSLPLIRPTMICSVPVLFNKVYDGVIKKINEGSPLSKKIFNLAMKISRKKNSRLEMGQSVGFLLNLQHQIFDKIVFSKIRDRLGGKLRFMAAGGAATSLTVLHFFEDIGIPICEGYGLTETSPVITASSPSWKTRRLGTVGVPLCNADVRIVDPETHEDKPIGIDGEIVVSAPSVMVGYRNNPKANEEVFFYKDGKRFFKTGDLGRMIDGKFLKITGRIKEQYKLENGKYVVPAPLEDSITRSQFVAQSLLYGDNKKYNIVFIVPDFVELKAWATKKGITGWSDDITLAKNEEVIKLLSEEVSHACTFMKSFERPLKWITINEPFSQENNMMTPKMSIKRNNVLKVYSSLVQDAYDEKLGYKINYKVPSKDDSL